MGTGSIENRYGEEIDPADLLKRQELFLDNTNDGIIVTHPGGEIVDFNPAAERMFGYDRRKILGLGIDIIAGHEEDARSPTRSPSRPHLTAGGTARRGL